VGHAEYHFGIVAVGEAQQLIADINFADYESRMYFDRQLRKSGLFDRLEEMGIEDGDTVSIYDFEFEYER
jgi:GTP-binding protein